MSSDDITVKLTGPETWKPWNEELKKRAVNLRLWALINPDSPRRGEWMEEPTKPDITKYSKRLEAPPPRPPPPAPLVTGSASSASTQGTTQTVGRSGTPAGNSAGDLDSQASVVTPVTHIIHVPVPTQELTDPRGKPKTAEELTERAFKAYNLDLNEYYKVQAAYEKQHDNCYALSNWITKSVAPHYRSTSCKAEHTLDVWYEKLKIQVGTSTASQRLAALENYEAAIKPLTKTPKNPMEWINNWEKALLEAQNEGVGSATDSILWWNALAKATRGAGWGQWFDSYFLNHEDKINSGEYDTRTIVNAFSHSSHAASATKTRGTVTKGAFLTYHDHDSDAEDDGPRQQRGRSPPRSSSKRKYTGVEESGCPACGMQHPLPRCYHLFPELAPDRWVPKSTIITKVYERLEKDEALRAEYNRIRRNKRSAGRSPGRGRTVNQSRSRERNQSRSRERNNSRNRREDRSRSRDDGKTRVFKRPGTPKKEVRFKEEPSTSD